MAVRSSVLYYEGGVACRRDIACRKNNYFWTKGYQGLDFIANGDMAIVEKVYGTETRYGRRFCRCEVCVLPTAMSLWVQLCLTLL